MLRSAERIQIDKYRVSIYIAGILHTQMIRICEHAHNLFLHICFCVGQIDTVAKGFAHLRLAVDAGQS